MADSSRFDFCPKCGALARDGVCQSCGYQFTPQPQNNQQQPVYTEPQQAPYGQGAPVQPQQAPHGQGASTAPQQIPQGQTGYNGQPQYSQATYTGQPNQNGVQGYAPYIPPVPPEIKKKGSQKKAVIWGIVIGVVVLAMLTAIMVGIGNVLKSYLRDGELYGGSDRLGISREKDYAEEYELDDQPINADAAFFHYITDTTSKNMEEDGQDVTVPYYSGPYNAIRTDLSYQIGFTEEACYSNVYPTIGIDVEYPQIISGDLPIKNDINNALYYEYSYFEEYLKEFINELTNEDDTFQCIVDANVTYMDEKYLSVVFTERISMMIEGEDYSYIILYCLNFDLENGSLLDNTQILNMDENFASDFRQREIFENGDEALTFYSDQEIQEMLNDLNKLVVFFTPMGMEVGLNLDDIVVYVTYEDYQLYLNY